MKSSVLKRNILIFYFCSLLFEVFRCTFYGVSSLFMLQTLNLALYEISIVKMFNPIAIAIFEIPTGIFADRFGRKINFIVSSIISSLGFLIYAFATKLWHAALAEGLYSIGLAFHTGSLDALLISQAKENSKINISKMLSNAFAFKTFGILIGGTIGILLSFKSMRLPWLFGAFGFPIVAMLSLLIKGDVKQGRRVGKIFSGFKNYLFNKEVLLLTILSIGITLVNIPFFNYWQIFMEKSLGIERNSIGFIAIYVIYNLLIVLGGLSVPFFNRVAGKINTLSIFSILVIIPTMAFVLVKNSFLALSSFMISEFARGVFFPSFEFVFNKFIPDENRSLYLSKLSLFNRMFSIASYSASGFIAYLTGNVQSNIYILSSIGLLMSVYSIIKIRSLYKRDLK